MPRNTPMIKDSEAMDMFREYFEEGKTVRVIAEIHGCSPATVSAYLNKQRLYTRYEKVLDARHRKAAFRQNIAVIKAMEESPNMIQQLLEIAGQDVKSLPVQYQYVVQNAAVDLLNRAAVREKETESREVRVVIAGGDIDLGTPEDGERMVDEE